MNDINVNNAIQTGAAQGGNSASKNSASSSELGSWYEAMAQAWGSALDNQAQQITDLSSAVGEGGKDNPSTMVMLTTESLRMQFLSSSASTATTTVGQALESLARK